MLKTKNQDGTSSEVVRLNRFSPCLRRRSRRLQMLLMAQCLVVAGKLVAHLNSHLETDQRFKLVVQLTTKISLRWETSPPSDRKSSTRAPRTRVRCLAHTPWPRHPPLLPRKGLSVFLREVPLCSQARRRRPPTPLSWPLPHKAIRITTSPR